MNDKFNYYDYLSNNHLNIKDLIDTAGREAGYSDEKLNALPSDNVSEEAISKTSDKIYMQNTGLYYNYSDQNKLDKNVVFRFVENKVEISLGSLKEINEICSIGMNQEFKWDNILLSIGTVLLGAFLGGCMNGLKHDSSMLSVLSYSVFTTVGVGLIIIAIFLKANEANKSRNLFKEIQLMLPKDFSKIRDRSSGIWETSYNDNYNAAISK